MDTVDYMPSSQPNQLRKQSLEPWQVEDAERLRALFVRKTDLSQAEFGETYGIGTLLPAVVVCPAINHPALRHVRL